MKNRLILFNLFALSLLCSCGSNNNKANDTVPLGTDSSMMINNDSGMNRGNPKTDTAMNHGNPVMPGDTSAGKKNKGADTTKLKKAAPNKTP